MYSIIISFVQCVWCAQRISWDDLLVGIYIFTKYGNEVIFRRKNTIEMELVYGRDVLSRITQHSPEQCRGQTRPAAVDTPPNPYEQLSEEGATHRSRFVSLLRRSDLLTLTHSLTWLASFWLCITSYYGMKFVWFCSNTENIWCAL